MSGITLVCHALGYKIVSIPSEVFIHANRTTYSHHRSLGLSTTELRTCMPVL